MSKLGTCGIMFVALSASAASAQSPAEHDAEGRAAHEAGVAAYSSGEFAVALDNFQRSYELSQRAALLFNIGQCHDRLQQDREAVTALESYLAQEPDADNRATVVARVEILRQRIAEEDATAEAQARDATAAEERAANLEHERDLARAETVEAEEPSIVEQWWFWTIIGVVVLGATITAVGVAVYDPGVNAPLTGDGGRVITALEW